MKNIKKNEPHEIVSRRDRPAKPPLSKEGIVDTALELLSKNGFAGLSMRKVAAALDTGPASLYVYFSNVENLHNFLLDRVLGEVDTTGAGKKEWRDRLKAILISYLKALASRPGIGKLALSTISNGPNMLRIADSILSLLLEAGLKDHQAAIAMDGLILNVTAIAAEKDLWLDHGDPLPEIEKTLQDLSSKEYPSLYKLRKILMDFNDKGNNEEWLEMMINGISRTS